MRRCLAWNNAQNFAQWCFWKGLGRALASNAKVILADEPTGNLDSKSGADVMRLIQKLSEQQHTIVLITHNNDVASMAQRTVYVRDGRLFDSWEEAELA